MTTDAVHVDRAETELFRKAKPSRRRTWLGVAVAVALTAAAATWWLRPGSDLTDQLGIRPTTTYETFPLDANQPFSLGDIVIRDASAEVEILEIEPLASANVEYLGAFTVWPRDLIDYGAIGYAGPGFPAPAQRTNHPATGVVVPAEELTFVPSFLDAAPPLTVTLGFRIREGVVGAVNGLILTYRVGDKVVRQHVREALIACVKPQKSCVPGDGSDTDAVLRDLGILRD